MDGQVPTVSTPGQQSSSLATTAVAAATTPPPVFYDPEPVLCVPVTPQQVAAFNTRGRKQPGLLMPDGSEYYGDVLLQKPHGLGIMLFKSSSGLYTNGDRYGGSWVHGLFHGEGVLLTSAFTHQGGWFEGKMHGHGTMVYNRRVSDIVLLGISVFSPFERTHMPLEYIGEFHRTHHRHGRGTMRYANGDVYEGMWASNRRHGHGRLITDDGEVYEGQWVEDERHGYGKINYVDGGEFKGMMVHDKRHGEGVMMFPNGDEYYGSFTNDKLHGHGTMRYKNGDVYEGMWKDGLRNGEGKYTLRKKGATVEGCFLNGLIQGRGVVQHPGVSTFVGEFDRGERKHGTLFWHSTFPGDMACYQGEWLGEAMHGRGLLWYRNGGFFFGTFANNKKRGSGNMWYADGSEFSGCFNNDLREGPGILQLAGGSIQAGLWSGDILVEGYDGEWDGVSFNGIGHLLLREVPASSDGNRKGKGGKGRGGNKRSSSPTSTLTVTAERGGENTSADAMASASIEHFGLFRHGARHGPGIFRLAGHVVMGSWTNDVLSCESGSWEFPSGDVYVGRFHNGVRDGPDGRMWFVDGSHFAGNWRLDAPAGGGVFHATDPMDPIYAPERNAVDSVDADASEARGDANNNNGDDNSLGVIDLFLSFFRRKTPHGNKDKRHITGFREHYMLQGEWDLTPMPYALYRSLLARGNISSASDSGGSGVTGASLLNNSGSTAAGGGGGGGGGAFQKPPASVSLGMLEGRGTAIFKSGVCLQTEWLHNHPRLMLPHRHDAPFHDKILAAAGKNKNKDDYNAAAAAAAGTATKSCTFCERSFTFFRKETVCTLCERTSCSSCLHPIDVRGHPRLEALVQIQMGHSAGGGSSDITDAPAHVPGCVDCARTVVLGIGFGVIWLPMDLCEVAASEENETTKLPLEASEEEEEEEEPPFSKASSKEELYVVYKGYMRNCVPSIYGSMWWGKKAYYHGSFDEGRRHGKGLQMMPNGERYFGHFSDNEWHGLGTYCADDGSAYEGIWEHGKLATLLYHGEVDEQYQRHGRGRSYEADGSRYNGEWHQGEWHGTGIMQKSDGSVYSGQFAFGRVEGEGKMLQNTSVFHGSFLDGKKHGKGMERFGECVVEGEWRNGMLSGFVRLYDGLEEAVYETTYINGNECDDCFLPSVMVDDVHTQKCAQCLTAFSLFLRRHHCRLCGEVVCDGCSQRRAAMPLHFKVDGHQRVCDRCFQRLEQRRMLGIRRYKNGEVYAGCWTRGRWVSRGLFRRADGSIIVMDAVGHPIVAQENTRVAGASSEATTTTTTTTREEAAEEATAKTRALRDVLLDAAPDAEVLRQLPASPATEVDAFSLWWSMMLSATKLSLPLELDPLVRFEFPRPPLSTDELKLFSLIDDADDDAAAVRAARFTPAIPPQMPHPPLLPENGVPPRPAIVEAHMLQRIKDSRMEMFPAHSSLSTAVESEGAVVLSCYHRTPLLPPIPRQPQPDTNEHVDWNDWNTRKVPSYHDTAAGTRGGPAEWQHVPFACPFARAVVDDADRAVRGDTKQWLPKPLAGPQLFSISEAHTTGVVVHQQKAKKFNIC